VIRWPKGALNSIVVPPHPGSRIDGFDIVATFHTHPNTGPDYLQEPSETDRRAVRDDPNLKGQFYQGELVVAQAKVYLITSDGSVAILGETESLMALRVTD
jgi:hypothetical protein